MVVDGRLFVASGRRQTWYGKYWKQWPQRVEEDDRIILRVDDSLYEQRLVPIKEGEIILPILRNRGANMEEALNRHRLLELTMNLFGFLRSWIAPSFPVAKGKIYPPKGSSSSAGRGS